MKVISCIFKKSGVQKKVKYISKNVSNKTSNKDFKNTEPNKLFLESLDIPDEDYIRESASNEVKSNKNINEYLYFFPYSWIWTNTIMGFKYIANSTRASSQFHIIQDFYLEASNKISYNTSFVGVLIKVIQKENSHKRLVAICNACNFSNDLVRYLFNFDWCPSFFS